MESRRLPSRRAKRGDSPVSSEKKPSSVRGTTPSKRVSPARNRISPNRKVDSPIKIDPKKRGRPTTKNQDELKDSIPIVMTKKLPVPTTTPGQKLLKASSSSSYSVKTTTSVRTVNLSGGNAEHDAEISRLTTLGQTLLNRRSTSKIPTPLHHLTPTPTTEQSRQSRSVSRSVYEDEDNYSRTEYSDNEEVDDQYKSFQPTELSTKNIYSNVGNVSSSTSTSRKVAIPREFGGMIGITLLLLIIPTISYYLQWCCSKSSNKCEFKKINLTGWNLKYMEKVFDIQTIGFYIAFQVTILILSSFPLGRVICLRYDRGLSQYYFNSFTVGLLTIIGFLIGEFYLKYSIADFISKHYLRFCIFGILNAIISSFWFYILSRMQAKWTTTDQSISDKLQNPYGKTGNFIIDYGLGRDINPKWCGFIDIKLSYYRISLITMLTISIMLILKNLNIPNLPTGDNKFDNNLDIMKFFYNKTEIIDHSALFCTILFLIYTIDLIIFEHHLASSFELQQEGVGALLLLRYAITPYFLASLPKYSLEHKSLNLPFWSICTISIIFTIGILIKRAANGIKYKFRMNPNLIQFQYGETVPTFQGRRLLCHHLWSRVRQPNYTGDIITLLAMLSPIYWKLSYPPICCYLLLIILLVHRSVRVNARNFDRYSSAWTRYCTKVRHLIIPKVF